MFYHNFCLQRAFHEQQLKTKRQQAPHIRASDLQIRSDGNKETILAYNGNKDIQKLEIFFTQCFLLYIGPMNFISTDPDHIEVLESKSTSDAINNGKNESFCYTAI